MSKRLFTMLSILFLLGCSSGGGGGSSPTAPSPTPSHAPGISNLSYSPHSATKGQGGGVVTVTGSFDFVDADGDVTTLSVNYNGAISTAPATNVSGVTVGTLAVVSGVYTTTAGTYPFQVWVTDSKGNISNKLSGTFTVN